MSKIQKVISVITFKHPGLNKRKVSVIFINNKLDLPSFMFLCREATNGGRKESVAGKTSHGGRAYKIAEMYDHLYDKGLTWQTAEEEDIKEIRNSMLHWNMHDEHKPKDYMIKNENGDKVLAYNAIKNDSMNQKLSVWFKFFNYQQSKEMPMKMYLSSKTIKVSIPDAKLQHLNGKKIGRNTLLVERWDLMVPPSPPKLYFPAITKTEYEAFKTQLIKIDSVYAAIAEFAVETGLRKDALLNVSPSFFKNVLRDINMGGKTLKEGFRHMPYENKGGKTEHVKVPLKAMMEINHIYLASNREDRMFKHVKKHNVDMEYMWYREDGKKVEAHDLDKAFREASLAMGRTQGIDNIRVHHLRHTYATWTVIDGAKALNIDLMQLDAMLVPGLIKYVQMQLAHTSDETTSKYIVTAILMISPKSNGPMINSHMINKSAVLKDMLLADSKLYFGEEFDNTKFNPIEWAKFKRFDMDSDLINVLQKDLKKNES